MMHIARGGTQIGTFSEEEVRQGLASGQFLASDLGWRDGMADWLPLSGFPDLAGTAAAPAFPVAPAPASSGSGRTGLPWEHRKELGFFNAWFETVKLVLLDPSAAFSRMRLEGGLWEPLIFRIMGGYLGVMVAMAMQVAFSAIGPRANTMNFANAYSSGNFNAHFTPLPSTLLGATAGVGFLIACAIFAPVAIAIAVFIGSFVVHVCLMLVGGATKSFETTMRVLCFSGGSTALLAMVPCCGGLILLVWQIVCCTVGLSKTHEISTGRALVAILLPMLVCCGVGIAAALAVSIGLHHRHF